MKGQAKENLTKYIQLIKLRREHEDAKFSTIFIPTKLKKYPKLDTHFVPYLFRFLVKDIKNMLSDLDLLKI